MKKKDDIKILINDHIYEEVSKPDKIFGSLFSRNLDIYPLMSIDTIKQHITMIIELVEELEPKLTLTIQKTIKTMRNMIHKVDNKNIFITYITNFVLAQEGLGLMPGFGCATAVKGRITGRLNLNPEKQPMMFIKP